MARKKHPGHVDNDGAGDGERIPGNPVVVPAQQHFGSMRPGGSGRHDRYGDRAGRAAASVFSPADCLPIDQLDGWRGVG